MKSICMRDVSSMVLFCVDGRERQVCSIFAVLCFFVLFFFVCYFFFFLLLLLLFLAHLSRRLTR